MRKTVIAALAAALCATAFPAAARDGQPRPAAPAQQADRADNEAANPDRRICVTERLSGSRMPRRVCRTAREWRALDDGSDAR
jgi:hypothetical protein